MFFTFVFNFTDNYGDEEVKQKLLEAFEMVSKGFVEDLINGPLMEKMSLEVQIPEVCNLLLLCIRYLLTVFFLSFHL